MQLCQNYHFNYELKQIDMHINKSDTETVVISKFWNQKSTLNHESIVQK